MSSERNRRQASQVLFDLVSTLEPRVRPLAKWFTTVFETTEKWYESEGNQGVKRMKDILHYGWSRILGYSPEPLSWTRANNQGLPDLVAPLVTWARGKPYDPRLYSAVLTLVRITDLWQGNEETKTVARSLEIIESSRVPGTAKKEIERFSEFVRKFFEAYPKHPLTRAYCAALHLSDSHEYLYRESKGPNGPLTLSAHKDIASLEASMCSTGASLYQEVKSLETQVIKSSSTPNGWEADSKLLKLLVETYGPDWPKSFSCAEDPGKLSLKPEKGGKVRLVAQPDFYSQVALKPIHDWLMEILKRIPADCTFDQRKAIPRIVKWQNDGGFIASFDQSACTDRFPFEFQLQVIKDRFGIPMMESLQTVMADRVWSIRLPDGKTRRVRWSVGQPLGMFASWPLMALTHHLMVQYCYWLSHGRVFQKDKPFNRYVICGDDIVIADLRTARQYQLTCKRLGMVINESKSFSSGRGTGVPPVSEFAKITVVRGAPLFPLKPNMVLRAVEDVRYAIPLVVDLVSSETWAVRLQFLKMWIRRVFPKEKTYLTSLLTIPREFGGLGFRDDRSIRRLVEAQLPEIHPFIYFIGERIRSGLKKENSVLASCESLADELEMNVLRGHPAYEYFHSTAVKQMYTAHLRESRIPSTYDIVCRLLTSGLGPFDRFLVDKTQLDFPVDSSAERRELRLQTTWQRVFRKDRSVRHRTKTPFVELVPGMEAFLAPDPGSYEWAREEVDHRSLDDPGWFVDSQVGLIKSVLLGKRSSQAKA